MKSLTKFMDSFGAILLAIIWIAPLLFAFWAATHSTSDAVNLNLFSPWTLDNFRVAWDGAPWLKYFINTFMLGDGDPDRPVHSDHFGGLCLCAAEVSRQGLRVHSGVDAAVHPARSSDRGELRHGLASWVCSTRSLASACPIWPVRSAFS